MQIFGALLVAMLLLSPTVAHAEKICAPHSKITAGLLHNKYMLYASALTDQGMMMQIYIGARGDAVMTMTDHEMNSCVIAHFRWWAVPKEWEI